LFMSHFCNCSLRFLLQPWIGKGCVFTYDAVGSYERVGYSSQGSGSTLIMPFLDNQLKSPSPLLLPAQVKFLNCVFLEIFDALNRV
jgi:20S proteasome subunit beta 6